MTFRVDLHLHTVFSGDSTISPKLIVSQLHEHPFIKGVAITDHNTLDGYFKVLKLASAYEDLLILPGVEIGTEEGDIVVLGVEETPAHCTRLEGAIEFAKSADGVIVIPHPYRSFGLGELALNIEAHAVEVLNTTATPNENMLAQRLAKAKNLPGVAGTDAHKPEEMWAAFTEVACQEAESVLDAIRNGLVKSCPSFLTNTSNETRNLEGDTNSFRN